EFVTDLPKTISGKIRRVQLRRLEHEGITEDPHRGRAYTQADFPELKGEAERKLDQTAG
ncbi:AMP-dependent synthetase, partial [Escherichia coli]|nr:AMP-dependent synthetase [Escherichia coli]